MVAGPGGGGEEGMTASLPKPVRQAELHATLGLALSGRLEVAAAPAKSQPATLSGRVLLVEDNATNQAVAEAMLRSLGCAVDIADSGPVALEALAKADYDLVLMDCRMPEMDGLEATRRLRAGEREGSRRVPVIALTADVTAETGQACLDAGMDGYLSKPISPGELGRVLTRWLGGEDRSAPMAANLGPGGAESPGLGTRELLDERVLDRIRSLQRPGRPDLFARVVTLYLRDTPALIAGLRKAVASQDADALVEAAHALKSSSAHLGASALAGLAKDLETRGKTGALDGAEALVAQLEQAYGAVRQALRSRQRKASPGNGDVRPDHNFQVSEGSGV